MLTQTRSEGRNRRPDPATAIRLELPKSSDNVDLLILCHEDARLTDTLHRVMPTASTAYATLSQREWDLRDPRFAEAVMQHVHELQPTCVLLAASSIGGVPTSRIEPDSDRGIDLLSRVHRQQLQVAEVEAFLADQLAALRTACDELEDGARPSVDAALHRAEGGGFVVYDSNTARFREISPSQADNRNGGPLQ